MTLDEMKEKNKAAGRFFWSLSTVRTFRSQTSEQIHEGPAGVFFVVSTVFVDGRGVRGRRSYEIRQFLPNGDVRPPHYRHYLSLSSAHACAERIAQGQERYTLTHELED